MKKEATLLNFTASFISRFFALNISSCCETGTKRNPFHSLESPMWPAVIYHPAVRWLRRGDALQRVSSINTITEILNGWQTWLVWLTYQSVWMHWTLAFKTQTLWANYTHTSTAFVTKLQLTAYTRHNGALRLQQGRQTRQLPRAPELTWAPPPTTAGNVLNNSNDDCVSVLSNTKIAQCRKVQRPRYQNPPEGAESSQPAGFTAYTTSNVTFLV